MYRFGPFEVDFESSQLRKSGTSIKLQDQPMKILEALLRQPGELVTREQLRDILWPSDTFVDFERSLNAAVAKLRQALLDSADQPIYVETVARKGYRFVAPVTEVTPPIAELPPTLAEQPQPAPTRRGLLFAGLGAISAGALGLAAWKLRHAHPVTNVGPIHFTISTPQGTRLSGLSRIPQFAVSPDGRNIVFTAANRSEREAVTSQNVGTSCLWLRALASDAARRLEGTEGASWPFWSPDSREIGFVADGKLKRIAASGGPTLTIQSLEKAFGATWGSNGEILFSTGGCLKRVNVSGGGVSDATKLNASKGELHHVSPEFLPDSDSFLYFIVNSDPSHSGMFLSMAGGPPRLVMPIQTRATFAPPDHLLFVREGGLYASKWDPRREFVDQATAVPLVHNVNTFSVGQSSFAVSRNGVLVYRLGPRATSQIACYRRDGTRVKTIGGSGEYLQFTLSPDGKMAALQIRSGAEAFAPSELALLRMDSGVLSRFELGRREHTDPVWSPDSQQFAFASYAAEGAETEILVWTVGERYPRRLFSDGTAVKPDDWSPDGRYLLCRRDNQLALAVPTRAGVERLALGDTAFYKDQLAFSPDGKWVAYNSKASARPEVFIAAFPAFTSTMQVSTDGGVQPRWNSTGTELFYVATDGAIMSVGITPGSSPNPSAPKELFRPSTAVITDWGSQYAVSKDGLQFYILEPVVAPEDVMHVITNWQGTLPV